MTRSVFAFRYGIFDLDGTLVDTMADCGRIFADLVADHGVDPDEARAFYYETTGSPMREQFREILRRHGKRPRRAELEELWERFGERFGLVPTTPFPGAIDILDSLAASGVILFLSSASPDATVARRISDMGAERRFTMAYGSTAVPKGVVHVDAFARHVGLPTKTFAKAAFLCGDGETDMRIATNVGAHPIGVLGTVDGTRLLSAGAKRIIRSVADLSTDP